MNKYLLPTVLVCGMLSFSGCGFPGQSSQKDDPKGPRTKDSALEFIETKTYDSDFFSLDIPTEAIVREADDIFTISYQEGVMKVGFFDPYTESRDGKGNLTESDLPKDVVYYDDAPGMASALYYDTKDGLVKAQLQAMQASLAIKE